jgi:hypothetical protein
MVMKSMVFWVIIRRRVVIIYRRTRRRVVIIYRRTRRRVVIIYRRTRRRVITHNTIDFFQPVFYLSLILYCYQYRDAFLWAILSDFLIKIQYAFTRSPVCDTCPRMHEAMKPLIK